MPAHLGHPPARTAGRRRGFTLTELLVAMALGIILVGVIAFVFLQSQRIYTATLDEVYGVQSLRGGLDVIARDLRAVQFPLSGPMNFVVAEGDDGADPPNARDLLRFVTLTPDNLPNRIDVFVNDRGQLVREARDWDGSAWPTNATSTAVFGPVQAFMVEYSSVDSETTSGSPPTYTETAGVFVRGDPPRGPTASDGAAFVWRGSGTIDAQGVLVADDAWDGNSDPLWPPQGLARTAHVFHSEIGGAYRVRAVQAADTIALVGAPPGTAVQFVLPLLPKSVRLSITIPGEKKKSRSLQRVIPVAR